MKVTITIENRIWNLAQEWHKIDKANPLPETTVSPKCADPEWERIFDLRAEIWKQFLKKHRLLINKGTERFMGIKYPITEIKDKDEIDMALRIIQWQDKEV